MTALRLVFMGTPAFALPALAALGDAGHDIVCVYTQPPRKAGRGQRDRPSPVHEAAAARGIPVRHPRTLKDAAVQNEFAALAADAAVVAAYGLILPKPILDAPALGCFNIHASLLPRWRGAAPIQRAIAAGDRETGVTIMCMDEGLDTGDIVLAESAPIGPQTTASELHDRLAGLGARLIVRALDRVRDGTIRPAPQSAEGVTYAPKIERGEGRLDWRRPADELERLVRAFEPWPGAWFEHGGERIRVIAADVVEGAHGAAPGTVLDGRLTVACLRDALRPRRVQRQGRAAMDTAALLRGFPIPAGTVLPPSGGDAS